MAGEIRTDPLSRLQQFLGELKRRKVYRVAVVYVIGAVAGLELMDALVPVSRLPGWSDELFLGIAVFGFPLVVILAWAFELTPDGLRRTEPEYDGSAGSRAYPMAGLALLALAVASIWWYSTRDIAGGPDSTVVQDLPGEVKPAYVPAPAPGVLERKRPFIAVLPLENLSPDPENAYFAAGIHEEILSQLSKVSSVGVFARTTMNQYLGADRTISQIGQELGAAVVLEGSVRRAGDRVRITAQLIDAQTQDHLWAETYDRQLNDVFAVQEEIARQVVASLQATLSPEEEARIATRPTENIQAYDLYLKGLEMLHLTTREANLQAEQLFSQALDSDPGYARALAGLSWVYSERDGRLGYAHGEPAEQAIEYANRAIEMDPELAEGHEALGDAQLRMGRREIALAAYLEALRYDPNNAGAAGGATIIYYNLGQFDNSIRYAKRAAALVPDDIALLNLVSHVYKFLRMDDRAMEWLDRQLVLDPGHFWPRLLQAQYDTYNGECDSAMDRVQALVDDLPEVSYAWTGAAAHAYMCRHYAQAAEWARKSLEVAPGNTQGYLHQTPNLLALALIASEDTETSRETFASALQTMELRVAAGERLWNILWDLAALQAANGDGQLAIDTMEQAYADGFRFVRWLPREAAFDDVRHDPRYIRLVERMEEDVSAMRQRVIREERGQSPTAR